MRLPPEVEERIAPKFDWIRLLENAPVVLGEPPQTWVSPLFTHDRLCSQYCTSRQNGQVVPRVRPSVVVQVGTTLALRAAVDGTDAWCGVDRLAAKCKRHRVTVIAALRHLEAKQLVYVHTRGGAMGVPRTWATVYMLTRPPDDLMTRIGLGKEITAVYDWFSRDKSAG